MQFESLKATIALLWALALCTAAIANHVSSVSAWMMLSALAVLPSLAMMWGWNSVPQRISERIQKTLR